MQLFDLISIFVGVVFLMGWFNYKILKMPTIIGLMAISMGVSLCMTLSKYLGLVSSPEWIVSLVNNFPDTLFIILLCPLLFAAAQHVDLNELKEKGWEVGIFATLGVLIATAITGSIFHYIVFPLLGLKMAFLDALLFGSLIAATDPIAVAGILNKSNLPESVKVKFSGESLFNDGVGIVVFLILLGIKTGTYGTLSGGEMVVLFAKDFAWEAFGGAGLGFIMGWGVWRILRTINDPHLEIFGTIALVMLSYTVATHLHVSAPIAVVVAGLIWIGNHGKFAMSEITIQRLGHFWENVDVWMNFALFVLLGFVGFTLDLSPTYLGAGVIAVFVVLFARFVSIGIPVKMLKFLGREFSDDVIKLLTVGGLRGAISVALAMTLPAGQERGLLLTMTYVVVAVSILVQPVILKKMIAEDK